MSGPAGEGAYADRTGVHERTGLAWQRTALAVAAGSLLAARVADEGAVALLSLLVALPLSLAVLARSRLRTRAGHRVGVGVEGALLALAVVAIGAGEVVATLG